MRIRIINPNTTKAMTERMGLYAQRIAAPGTEIVAVSPDFGPPSIEGYYDEALAVPGLLAEIRKGEAEEFDGYVIACFGDPGLLAARELARGPVVGIAEAAMHFASVIAPGFSVVTTLARTCGMAWHLAEIYGMKRFCRNVRAVEVPVLDLQESKVTSLIIEECRRSLIEDGAGAIVLGCAGMVDLCEIIASEIGVPVIDGVTAGVKFVESLVALGLSTSKRGDYAWPLPKKYHGLLAGMSPT